MKAKAKVGGGNHLQPYDEDTGQYTDEIKSKTFEKDMESLVMVYMFGFDLGEFKFHFPKKGIHNDEYCGIFVRYIRDKRLYGEAHIDQLKLERYLFEYRDKNDKSKYMTEVLGFENNQQGWEKAKFEIINGLDFKTMRHAGRFQKDCLKVAIDATINDVDGKGHDIVTIWEMQKDFSLRFITLEPRRD